MKSEKNGNRVFLVGAALLLAAATIAAVPNVFVAGSTISAEQMNANFGALEEQIATLEAQVETARRSEVVVGDERYALDAVFVMSTAGRPELVATGSFDGGATTGAFVLGEKGSYAAGKAACQLVTGSQSARMCTADDMQRSAQMDVAALRGFATADGFAWVAGGLQDLWNGESGYGEHLRTNDCAAWTDDNQTEARALLGPAWSGMSDAPYGAPGRGECDQRWPIACCDHPAS